MTLFFNIFIAFLRDQKCRNCAPRTILSTKPDCQKNLEIIRHIREESGAKSVLALKCLSTWCMFDLMRQYMDGTTSKFSLRGATRHEKFGKEVHAYSVAYSAEEVEAVAKFADKVIFNSVSQLNRFHDRVSGLKVGLRVNPGISYSPL